MGRNNQAGVWGEALAAEFLKNKGFSVLDTRYRSRFGEIDLIASDGRYLVFAEVKLRKSADFARAAEFVDFHKQNRIRTTAEIYLSEHATDLQPRFDVIEIYAPEGMKTISPEINHMEDAFE